MAGARHGGKFAAALHRVVAGGAGERAEAPAAGKGDGGGQRRVGIIAIRRGGGCRIVAANAGGGQCTAHPAGAEAAGGEIAGLGRRKGAVIDIAEAGKAGDERFDVGRFGARSIRAHPACAEDSGGGGRRWWRSGRHSPAPALAAPNRRWGVAHGGHIRGACGPWRAAGRPSSPSSPWVMPCCCHVRAGI